MLGQRYAKYLPSTTKYIRAVKYQTLDILWHAAINVHRAWLVMTRRVTGVRNMTLSDTPRFPTRHVSRHVAFRSVTRRVSWNITAPKAPRNYSFHAVQGKKHIPASQIIEGWVNHDTLSRSRLYYLLWDKFCAFSVLDLLWNLTKGFVSFFLSFLNINTEVN